jgi:hypothetical protein
MNITTIRDAAETTLASALTGYKELPFQFDIAMNESRSLESGYAVVWGEATQNYDLHQTPALEQELIVTVTKRVYVRGDDDVIVTAGDSVYSALGAIIRSFVVDKLSRTDLIYDCRLRSLGEPERVGQGRDILAFTLRFGVKYPI